MTVAVDVVSTNFADGSTASPSWTHTPVGVPTAVAVCIAWRAVSPPTITSVTYGGVLMAQANTAPAGVSGNCSIWGLANPASGPKTVQVNFSGLPDLQAGMYAVTVTGSDTTTCFSGSSFDSGVSQLFGITLASNVAEIVIDVGEAEVTLTATPDVGQTSAMNIALNGGFAFGSYLPGVPSTTTGWTLDGGNDWGLCIASFKAANVPAIPLLGQACL